MSWKAEEFPKPPTLDSALGRKPKTADIIESRSTQLDEGPMWGKLKSTARSIAGKTVNKKPNWSDAPKWANYLALQPSSGWVWMEKKSAPTKPGNEDSWPDGGKKRFDGHVSKDTSNWEKTLEKRP